MACERDSSVKQPVAIVGISADLPSGSYGDANLDYKGFIEFLLNKGEAYTDIPDERFNQRSWTGDALGKVISTRGSFLKDIGQFDYVEFGVSAKDARAMALSTRKLIELSFLALLDSGIDYRGRNIGCYAAATAHDILNIAEPDEFEARGSFAGIPCMVANKISYHLDLRGPSIPTDTACSSSLTALHLAVQGLRLGECEAAVVAGCQLNLRVADFVQYSQGSVLAPDGKCKPFDVGANGFSRGEGAVVVILKTCEDAMRDGDYIYGTILGTSVNSSGSIAPAYAPVASAQMEAMRRAYQGTGRDPRDVDFVEMHATGTAAGDPIESNWVGESFARDSELLVGSVKGNIGHLEVTAFLASLCKVCGIMETSVIPPNVNLRVPNPAIQWDKFNLRVPLEPTSIRPRSSSGRLLISMSSSGIGGANGHVVLESPPLKTSQNESPRHNGPALLIAGGLSPRSATTVGHDLIEVAINNPEYLDTISTVFGRRSRQMTWRTFAVTYPDQLQSSLQFSPPVLAPREQPALVFLFSGQGPQHINMGRQLFKRFAVFRATILELDEHHRELTGVSFMEQTGLFGDIQPSQSVLPIWPISIILPSLSMIQIALYDLLCSWGLRPDVVFGHSAGETALIYASGAASKLMAFEIAIARGRAMSIVEKASGGMAALSCTPSKARLIIDAVFQSADRKGVLEIACFNAPEAVAIAGHAFLVDKAIEIAIARDILARKIQTSVPVHCTLMELCREAYSSSISEVFTRYGGSHTPQIPTYSTATGDLLEHITREYFWDNTRGPVRFSQTVGAILHAHPGATFIELSPHPVLSSYLQDLGVEPSYVISPMRRSKVYKKYQEEIELLTSMGKLAIAGYNHIDYCSINSQSRLNHCIPLLPYPFVRKHVPYLPSNSRILRKQLGPLRRPLGCTDLRINRYTHPDIAQHIINGEPIMPASGFLEMALEMGSNVLWNVQFHSILPLSAEDPLPVEIDNDHGHWSVKSKPLTSRYEASDGSISNESRLHADGYMSSNHIHSNDSISIDISAIQTRCMRKTVDGFYDSLKSFAQYGPVFRRITGFYLGLDEALIEVRGSDEDLPTLENYVIHPAILDACIHVVVHPDFTANSDTRVYYLPSRIGSFVMHGSRGRHFPRTVYAHAVMREWLPDELISDVYVLDLDGLILCTMRGLVVERHYNVVPRSISERFDLFYQPLDISPVEWDTPCFDDTSSDTMTGTIRANAIPEECTERRVSCIETETLTSTGPHDTASVTDALLYTLKAPLKHIIETCGKRMLRILGIDNGLNGFHDKCCTLLESVCGSSITISYSASGKANMEDLALQRLMRLRKHVQVNVPTSLDESSLAASFDIVIGLDTFSADVPDQILERLTALLLPGGMLLLSEHSRMIRGPKHSSSGCMCHCSDKTQKMHLAFCPQTVIKTSEWWMTLCSAFVTKSAKSFGSNHIILQGQIPSLSLLRSEENTGHADASILTYTIGSEMEIQKALKKLDTNQPANVWFVAASGIDADGAKGFTRALRRELPLWDIGLAIVGFQCSPGEISNIIQSLGSIAGMERELFLDHNYRIHVPRFVRCPGPSSLSGIHKARPVTIPPSHVRVMTVAVSSVEAGCYGMVGRVTEVARDANAELLNSVIVTVMKEAPTEYVLVHQAAVASLPSQLVAQTVATFAPSFLIGGFALGAGLLRNPSRKRNGSIVVTHDDTPIGRGLLWFLNQLNLHPKSLASTASALQFAELHLRAGDIIISGYDRGNHMLDSLVTADARIFNWNVDTNLGYTLANDPWLIREILELAISEVWSRLPTTDIPSSLPLTLPSMRLFKSDAVYLLIGGIGSLGMHVALWMYQRGARHIVMTSRSGRKSLERAHDILALRILSYLESRPQLTLTLEQSDACSLDSLKKTVSRIMLPIAGCMLLSGVLSDRSFFAQDASSFQTVLQPKLQAFETLEAVLEINSLDFLITFSSISTFGNAGQTNYSSANTVLDGKTAKYKNAFSIISPAISDTVSMIGRPDQDYHFSRFQHLMSWAFSARELCDCLEDGILRLADGPFNIYVPNFDWDLVEKNLGPSPLYSHLVQHSPAHSPPTIGGRRDALEKIVIQHLNIAKDDFSSDIPFTSYGVDSLSAGRLSFALRPFLTVSPMQLLADTAFVDLEKRMEIQQQSPSPASAGDMFEWQDLNKPGQSVAKLVDHGDVPLILVHGASGNILPFMPLQQRFTTSLWALQTTPETPLHSVTAMAQFYFAEIKAAQAHGPYRIGAYSGTAIVAFLIAERLQALGDQVVQMCIIDHFPLLFASPYMQPDEETIRHRSPGRNMVRRMLNSMLVMYKSEKSAVRHRLAQEFEDAADGLDTPPYMQLWWSAFSNVATGLYEFMFSLLPSGQPYSLDALRETFAQWLRSIKVPVTLFIASEGVCEGVPDAEKGTWDDFGLRRVYPDGKVIRVEGTHFTVFDSEELASALQTGWKTT